MTTHTFDQRTPCAATSPRLFAVPDIEAEARADGSRVVRSRQALGTPTPTLGSMLVHWGAERPAATFLAERTGDGTWRTVTYAEALSTARSVGQSLLERGLGPDRPAVALSGNGVDHALLMLGCFVAGIPFAPVSAAYSLMSADFEKLRLVLRKLRPGLVYVGATAPFARALAAVDLDGTELVASSVDPSVTAFDELATTTPGTALERAAAAVGPDTVAKVLFTSGSTGIPKGVLNTHAMLCANQQSIRQVWPFTVEEPPVLIDWLPWSHTFGGNHNFNLVLGAGGALYVDAGKPVPGLVDITVANLRDVSPTIYFNVPAGYAALLPHLEGDDELAARFFARLRLIFYAAAALPVETWRRLDALARATTGGPVPMTSAWGSTETAPLATSAHFPLDGPGNIGVPVPGVEIKLVPIGAKHELRVRGPNVMPGYLDEPELTAAAFDDEGFYRIGDAGRLVDPDDPSAGIVFDGRIAEDFKLTTGTWVSVTTVRTGVVSAAARVVSDAVIAGHDRDEICVLAFLDATAAARLSGCEPALDELVGNSDVRAHVAECLARYNEAAGGSSHRVARVLLLDEPPSIDANEITDKGYVNQRAVLDRRAALVTRLYAPEPDDDVIVIGR